MSQDKFIWQHQSHGILGVFTDFEKLTDKVTKADYPVPNVKKMEQDLNTTGKFHYAVGLLSVQKVEPNADIEMLNL